MDSKKRIYLDIHILQTVPPSCVNRDDTGSPKTARYGGVTRARVSSQAWKRAVRLMFRDMFSKDEVGIRTKRVVELVKERITALKPDAEKPEKLAADALSNAGVKLAKDNAGTDALFFISLAQASALAKLAVAGEKTTGKKGKSENAYQKALKDYPSVDIALFGRMVASDPSLNYDAAAQVAHAISTHEVRNEFDYFTAMDDLAPEDSAGAAHLDTTEFNSCTMYRYATAGIHELAVHLGDEEAAVRAAVNFVRAFCLSMPTGKQNSFANRTAPETAYVAIRKDQPVNRIPPNLSHPLHVVPKVLDEVLSGVNRVGNQKVRCDLKSQLLKQEKVLVKAVGLASATDEIPGHKGQLSLFGD